jgi:hypothetical protein
MRQFNDVLRGVAERDQRFPARQHDRIEKRLIHAIVFPVEDGPMLRCRDW